MQSLKLKKLFLNIDKNLILIASGRLIQAAISVFSLKLITSTLSPFEIGKYNLFLVLISFYTLIFVSPFGQYVNRKIIIWNNDGVLKNIIFIYCSYLALASIFTFPYIFISKYYLNSLNDFNLYYLLFLGASYFFITNLNQTINPIFNMIGNKLIYVFFGSLLPFSVFICLLVSSKLFDLDSEAWITIIIICNSIVAFMVLYLYNKIVRHGCNSLLDIFYYLRSVNFRRIFEITLPILLSTPFFWFLYSGHRIIIAEQISLEFLGYLSIGFAIGAQITNIVESIVNDFFSPIFYSKIFNVTNKQHRAKIFEYLVNIKIPIFLFLAIYVTCFSHNILYILVSEKYYHIITFIIFGIWFEFFKVLANIFSIASMLELQTKLNLIAYIIGSSILFFILSISFFFDSENSLLIALLLSSFSSAFFMYILMNRIVKFRIHLHKIIITILICAPFFANFFIDKSIDLLNNISVLFISCFYSFFIFFIFKNQFKFSLNA